MLLGRGCSGRCRGGKTRARKVSYLGRRAAAWPGEHGLGSDLPEHVRENRTESPLGHRGF